MVWVRLKQTGDPLRSRQNGLLGVSMLNRCGLLFRDEMLNRFLPVQLRLSRFGRLGNTLARQSIDIEAHFPSAEVRA